METSFLCIIWVIGFAIIFFYAVNKHPDVPDNKYDIISLGISVAVATLTGLIFISQNNEKTAALLPILRSGRQTVVAVYIVLAMMTVFSAILSIRAEDIDEARDSHEKKHRWIVGNPKKVYNNICVICFFGVLTLIGLTIIFQ